MVQPLLQRLHVPRVQRSHQLLKPLLPESFTEVLALFSNLRQLSLPLLGGAPELPPLPDMLEVVLVLLVQWQLGAGGAPEEAPVLVAQDGLRDDLHASSCWRAYTSAQSTNVRADMYLPTSAA